ncbi:uncharacterized protein F5147DRAFT_658714 [Suillus discolor]|uniref:C2H2-type domain-containing protein n=1 Tax=Suillus discolor TaxID=1912936 RepID=A0A9P7ESD9_9AGAM|nr:uncharacterized protein F5147DRAFT_658714 [Suillus discolor]KAG2088373.1 hypothetical protein F5147DRAFT_658714 [Suillus discolor]
MPKIYVCSTGGPGCNQTFDRRVDLKRHEAMHPKNSPYLYSLAQIIQGPLVVPAYGTVAPPAQLLPFGCPYEPQVMQPEPMPPRPLQFHPAQYQHQPEPTQYEAQPMQPMPMQFNPAQYQYQPELARYEPQVMEPEPIPT